MAYRQPPPPASALLPVGLHDRDVDPIADARLSRRSQGSNLPVSWHQRLVVNPFLAVFGTILWFLLLRYTVQTRLLKLFAPVAASFVLMIFLLEYHCLDCGRTGRLVHWRKHLCERVEMRRLSTAIHWSFWPSVFSQLVWWVCWLGVAAGMLVLSRR